MKKSAAARPRKGDKPSQHQKQKPGREYKMSPRPKVTLPKYRGSGKLKGRAALITGGDSGIGRAVAVLFAREGADIAISYLNEEKDARETKRLVQREGRKCLIFAGDIGQEEFCQRVVEETKKRYRRFDILVNNAAEQHPQEEIQRITREQLQRTFRTNIFSHFYFTKVALRHFKPGAVVINTASVTAYRGS